MAEPSDLAAPAKPWAVRSLHFALPIGRGDHVATHGASPALVTSMEQFGVSVTQVDPRASQVPAGGADHAIVLTRDASEGTTIVRALCSTVRPGGTVLVAIPHARSIRRHIGSDPDSAALRRALDECGFTDVEVYGIRATLTTPQHLVPIDHPGALRWYVRSGFMPRTRVSAVAIAVASRLAPVFLAKRIFPDLAFLARRGTTTC